jgi:hypothetical protein
MRTTLQQGTVGHPSYSAKSECDGCTLPISLVGPLTRVRVTHVTGETTEPEYCSECLEIAQVSARPNDGQCKCGAFALPMFSGVEVLSEARS